MEIASERELSARSKNIFSSFLLLCEVKRATTLLLSLSSAFSRFRFQKLNFIFVVFFCNRDSNIYKTIAHALDLSCDQFKVLIQIFTNDGLASSEKNSFPNWLSLFSSSSSSVSLLPSGLRRFGPGHCQGLPKHFQGLLSHVHEVEKRRERFLRIGYQPRLESTERKTLGAK